MSVAAQPNRRTWAPAVAGGARLVLRRLRFDLGAAVTIVLLVALTSFLFAALPRLFERLSDRGIRYTLAHATEQARLARTVELGRVGSLAAVDARAADSQQALPPAFRALIGGRTFVARTPVYVGPPKPGLQPQLSLRVQSGVASHIRFVSGRPPAPTTTRIRTSFQVVPGLFLSKSVPVTEVALSVTNARQLRMRLGERVVFAPDNEQVDLKHLPQRDEQPLVVELVGLFEVKDPQAPFWFGDGTLRMADEQVTQDLETTMVFGQALVSARQYPALLNATRPLPLQYEYRYRLEPARLDAGHIAAVTEALHRIDARYAGAGPLDRRVDVSLAPVLDQYRGERSQAETLLALCAIALLACAFANLGLLGALTYDRRRVETRLSRTRGASRLETLAGQAFEGLLLAGPAALAGWALAVAVIPARGSSLSAWLALAIAAGTVALFVLAVAGVAGRPLRPFGRADAPLARPSPRRLALEALVLVAAGLGVYLLRRRGLERSGGFDGYLTAVPVLLGLACGIAALRLYPLPLALAARVARRGRGLAVHLGLSRAARQSEVTSLPLLVLILALAVAVFSATMLKSLERGQSRTAWRSVGADVRVDAAPDAALSAALITRLRAAGEVAPAYVQDVDLAAGDKTPVLLGLDVPAYQRVVAGTPAAVRPAPGLDKPSPIPGAVPALVSANWPQGSFFQVAFPDRSLNLVSIGSRSSLPGIPRGQPFVVASLHALRAAGERPVPNRLYLRHVGAGAARQAVLGAAPGARITSRSEVARGLRASPLVGGALDGFRGAIVVAAVYAAIAVALLALLAARSRSRDLALVRTMGGTSRDTVVLAAVELAPLVVVGLLLGIGLGIAIPHLIAPGLELDFFTGGASTIAVPWLPPLLFAAGVLLVLAVSVALAGARARRTRLNAVLRIGER